MKILAKNKRAYFDYSIEKTYDAGVILQWFEVKALKTMHSNIQDSVVRIADRELWIYHLDIPLYSKTSPILAPGYDPKRRRKLLVTKRELAKISAMFDQPGMVLIPLEIFTTKSGFIKLKLGFGKLKRKIEKRQIIKERDIQKQMEREIQRF